MTTNNDNMKVIVKEKSVYGKTLIYPVNEKAELFASMLQVKTFNERELSQMRELGFEVELIKLP